MSTPDNTPQPRPRRLAALAVAGRLALIGAMLMAITALASRNISEFVYQGF